MEIVLATERPPKKQLVRPQSTVKPRLVTPGEVISDDTNFMRGHGTYMEDNELLASTAGYMTRVNRLLTVTPLRQVYQGAVGDSIVGRITQVQTNRWKVDVHSRLDAELKLANIQLPGGEQRRKDLDDERGMRALLQEGDLICVEVQKVSDDGLLKLTARTAKFGKLRQGTLIDVSPSLLVLDKQRIHDLPCGARVIFGANGYIFITHIKKHTGVDSYAEPFEEVALEERKVIARLHNVVKLLATHSIMISPTSVMACYDQSIEQEYEIKDLLRPDAMLDLALATVQFINE